MPALISLSANQCYNTCQSEQDLSSLDITLGKLRSKMTDNQISKNMFLKLNSAHIPQVKKINTGLLPISVEFRSRDEARVLAAGVQKEGTGEVAVLDAVGQRLFFFIFS